MRRISVAYDWLLRALGYLSGGIFVVLALAISADVILRNIGVYSFAALLEITEYCLFVTTFLAAPWVLRLAGHVRVDLVLNLVPDPLARMLEIAADVAGLCICALLGWHGARITLDSFLRGDLIYKHLVVAEWILLIVIPFSCLLLAIEFAARIAAVMRTRGHPGGEADRLHGL